MKDPWYLPAEVYATELTGEHQSFVAVWKSKGTAVYCTFIRAGVALAVNKVELEADRGSVAAWARKIPSDGQLVGAVRRAGNSGLTAIAAVLGEQETLSEAYQAALAEYARTRGEATEGLEQALEAALAAYDKRLKKRPAAKVQNQVAQVREWLAQGDQTRDIIDRLTAMGLSESTAFRRLKEARSV